MKRRRLALYRAGLPFLALNALSLPAQALACREDQTLAECEEAAQDAVLPPLTEGLQQAGSNLLAETHQRLLNLPIGAAVGQALTTTTSLLPNFSLAGLPATGKDGGALRGDWNLGLPGADAHNSQLQVLAIPEPALARPVIEAVNAAGRSVDALKERLDVADDLSAQFTWSLRGHGFGRDLDQYRGALSSLMLQAFMTSAGEASGGLINDFQEVGCFSGPVADTPLKALRATVKDKTSTDGQSCERLLDAIVAEMPDLGRRQAQRLKDFAGRRKDQGLDRYADLVSNQPQLTVSVKRSERAPLVGASLTAARVGFETGWVNLNAFLRQDGEACDVGGKLGWGRGSADATASDSCADAYARYVVRNDKRLDAQDRLSAWLEYAHLEDMKLTQAVEGVDLRIEGGDRYTAGLGYGRVLWHEQHDAMSTRVDATGRYERYQNDEARQDRLVYSLVLTQRVGMLNIPLVLAYGDKSEYKGSGKDGLLANLGLSYDFGLPDAPALPQAALDEITRVIPLSGNGG